MCAFLPFECELEWVSPDKTLSQIRVGLIRERTLILWSGSTFQKRITIVPPHTSYLPPQSNQGAIRPATSTPKTRTDQDTLVLTQLTYEQPRFKVSLPAA